MKWLAKLLLLSTFCVPLSAAALFDQCKDLFPAQQIPSTPQVGRDLCFDDFAIYYSPIDKKPIYTVQKLNGEQLQAPHPRRTNQFYEEGRLPFSERALLSDYRGSGYDRGHNVPAGDMTQERGMAQSFSLANMMPQARQNNQGIWAKRVEEPTRQYIKRVQGDVFVFTGSVGQAGSIGKSKVTIPSHLYKLVYDPTKRMAWAYWVENTDEAQMKPLKNHFDFILNTVSAVHDLNSFLDLLKVEGKMLLVGIPPEDHKVAAEKLISKRRSIVGSMIGGIQETQEMLDYCAEHNIVSDVEVIAMKDINEAYERILKSDVKYRFVIDMKTL
jgi:DNA/RNA endonuclease G (NUC1)